MKISVPIIRCKCGAIKNKDSHTQGCIPVWIVSMEWKEFVEGERSE